MDGLADDIEQELAVAAEAVRELEVTEQRCDQLRRRLDEKRAELDAFRAQHSGELKDVERLEGVVSLCRVLATLRGRYEDHLERERLKRTPHGTGLARQRPGWM